MNESARKTIGRTKPGPDLVKVEAASLASVEVAEHLASGREGLTDRERAMQRELIQTKRQLDVERARVAVLTANGGKPTLRPIATDMERVAEMERIILSMADMTNEARLRHLEALFGDISTFRREKNEWLREAEAQAEAIVADASRPVAKSPDWLVEP